MTIHGYRSGAVDNAYTTSPDDLKEFAFLLALISRGKRSEHTKSFGRILANPQDSALPLKLCGEGICVIVMRMPGASVVLLMKATSH